MLGNMNTLFDTDQQVVGVGCSEFWLVHSPWFANKTCFLATLASCEGFFCLTNHSWVSEIGASLGLLYRQSVVTPLPQSVSSLCYCLSKLICLGGVRTQLKGRSPATRAFWVRFSSTQVRFPLSISHTSIGSDDSFPSNKRLLFSK